MSTTGKEYRLAIRIAGVIDKSFTTSLAAAKSTTGSFAATISAMDKDFTKLDRGYNKIMSAGRTCFRVIGEAATVAAAAVGAVSMAAIKVGSEFEEQMSTVQAISGANNEEMELLTQKARELGQSSVFSATEVGNAMEYMGMAGWKTEQILSGIDGVLNLAAASGEDFGMVSDIVTDDLTAFNMSAEETARMVDVMAQAAMNSNTNVAKMGDTFKYAGAVAGAMGYSIEDIAIATGIMASSGVKSGMAGTALRNIITRMAKPTKESKEAMDALGLSLTDSEGNMNSFYDIMVKLRESMAGMTETEKAYYGAELGGMRGMTGLLAIANATDEEFQDLTESIYNSEGAAEKMAEIRLDNLSGDVQIMKDAFADAGLEIYYQFNDKLRGAVQWVTELTNNVKEGIPEMIRTVGTEFPTLQRKFNKFAKPVFGGIVDAGKWLIKNGNGIVSVFVGIGTALAAYKIASTTVHVLNSIMSLAKLNPVTLVILGLVAALGALAGAYAAYKQHERDLIDQSLADHFGDIALSMGELQQVAEFLVSSDSLTGAKKALEEFGKLDGFVEEMNEAVSEIDKMNWKVSIGLALTEDENEAYKQAISDYVSEAQEYALQSQYAVSVNLQIAFGDGDGDGQDVTSKVNEFYQERYDTLSALGKQLNRAVTDAFNDGLLEIDEADKIANIQRQMAEIQESMATGELEAQLSMLGMQYANGGGLTPESFQNLQEELTNQISEATEAYRDSYVKNYASIQAARSAGYLSDSDYQNALNSLQEQYLENVGSAQAKAVNFQLETIMSQYADELGPAMQSYMQNAEETLETYTANGEGDWMSRPVILWQALIDAFSESDLDKTSQGAIAQLLESLQPSMEEMESLKQQYEEMGKEVPEWIMQGISDFAMLDVLSGANLDYDSVGTVLGQQLANSEYYDSFYKGMIDQLNDADYYVPEDVAEGISNAAAALTAEKVSAAAEANVGPAVEGMYAWSQNAIDEYYSKGFEATADVSITLNPIMRMSAATGNLTLPGWTKSSDIKHNAMGGIVQNETLSWLAENGPEAVIPLDGSRRAMSLWEKAGQLLGMESSLDGLDLDAGSSYTIEYSPTLKFYGAAPSKDDLTDALRVSQDEFDSMMERYLKTHSRVSFA